MSYPFKSLVFRPLPENPTPRDWWDINLLTHQLRAYTQAAIDAEARYTELMTVLVRRGHVKPEDFTEDLQEQAYQFAEQRRIELSEAIRRLEAWLQAHDSGFASSPHP